MTKATDRGGRRPWGGLEDEVLATLWAASGPVSATAVQAELGGDLAYGTITTIAGTGTPGFSGDGGAPTSAQIWFPRDVAVSPSGKIYIADNNNMRIREIK